MNQQLSNYLQKVQEEVKNLPSDRTMVLDEIVGYVVSTEHPKLNFICTHNSRRSHLSQLWAQTLANAFEISVETFSGGTEATAFNPNAVAAMERAGFRITAESDQNPKYQVYYDEAKAPIVAFSKRYEDPPNPTGGFAAIMTCSEADADCPVVFGADRRIKLFYEDPKIADGTPEEAKRYDERCRQIAVEMSYIFQKIKDEEEN